jgi:hypothetical protein
MALIEPRTEPWTVLKASNSEGEEPRIDQTIVPKVTSGFCDYIKIEPKIVLTRKIGEKYCDGN